MRSTPTRAAAELRPLTIPSAIACPRVCEHAGLGSSCLARSRFESILDGLLAAGYHFLGLDQYRAAVEGLRDASNGLLLTSDHGEVEFLDTTLPILRQREIPVVLFLAIASVGRVTSRGFGPLRQQTRHLSWSQLRRIMPNGVRVQSAGFESVSLGSVTPEVEYGDLIRSRRELERRLHEEAVALKYPEHSIDDRMADLARRAGFALAFGTAKNGGVEALYSLPRITLRRTDSAKSVIARITNGKSRKGAARA